MFKSIATIAAILVSSAAFAQETIPTVEKPMTEKQITAQAQLSADFATICSLATAEKLVLSKKAIANCADNVQPKAIKAQTRYTAGKTGAEFNTLIANIAIFNG